MNFHVRSFDPAMDAILINGTIKTKLWKSEHNFGSPNETLEGTVYLKMRSSNMAASYKQRDSLIREFRIPNLISFLFTTSPWVKRRAMAV